jgi:DNA polymerase (family 10)
MSGSHTSRAPSRGITNYDVADGFDRISSLLSVQNANPFRVRAYATAAERIRGLALPLRSILEEGGPSALVALEGIGRSLAAAIETYLKTGRLSLLDRLEGEICPEALFKTVPGIGKAMAERIHRELGIDTLEELEVAAHDGRLDAVPGFGPRRVRAVREMLSSMLGKASRYRALGSSWAPAGQARGVGGPDKALSLLDGPAVVDLLAIDCEYRDLAERDALVRIAPRRFNPTGERWLPLLHVNLGRWDVTAMFSNTASAHELGRTHDWVVIYADCEDVAKRYTVVTEHRGEMADLRVVRGRESECREYYRNLTRDGPSVRHEPEVLYLPGLEEAGVR